MKTAWLGVAVAVVFASGCAQKDWIDRTLVTVDVTGVWAGGFTRTSGSAGQSVGEVVFALQQQGAKVTGMMNLPILVGFPGVSSEGIRIEGTVSGDTFTFHQVTGQTIQGEFPVHGDEMTGSWAWTTTQTATLHRRQ